MRWRDTKLPLINALKVDLTDEIEQQITALPMKRGYHIIDDRAAAEILDDVERRDSELRVSLEHSQS